VQRSAELRLRAVPGSLNFFGSDQGSFDPEVRAFGVVQTKANV
jgi:hypothetical protein